MTGCLGVSSHPARTKATAANAVIVFARKENHFMRKNKSGKGQLQGAADGPEVTTFGVPPELWRKRST